MLKKVLTALLAACMLLGCAQKQVKVDGPVRAVWFAYLDYEETDLTSREAYEAEVDEVIRSLKTIGVNTVFLHAVAHTEAYYPSKIYPVAEIFADADYDPLAIFIAKAHAADIRVDAWIDPLRSLRETEINSREINPQISQWLRENNERLRQVDDRYYLNAGYPEVRELVCSVAREILENYAVDGIHLDDYFYPGGTDRRFDAYIFSKQDTYDTVEDFRRHSIDELVKDLHKLCRDKGVRFGISTAGNYELTADTYFADPAHWAEAHTVDYLAPQVYWGYEHPVKPYAETLQAWKELAGDVPLISGLAAYKVGVTDVFAGTASDEWINNHDMLVREIRTAEETGCSGYALFRYGSLFRTDTDAVKVELAGLIIEAAK